MLGSQKIYSLRSLFFGKKSPQHDGWGLLWESCGKNEVALARVRSHEVWPKGPVVVFENPVYDAMSLVLR